MKTTVLVHWVREEPIQKELKTSTKSLNKMSKEVYYKTWGTMMFYQAYTQSSGQPATAHAIQTNHGWT